MSNLEEIYQSRVSEFSKKAKTLAKKHIRWSFLRLIIFLVGGAIAVYCSNFGIGWGFLSFALFLPFFAYFIRLHQKIQFEKELHENLERVNLEEISALENNHNIFEDGSRFVDVNHPYSGDLDIFGPHSIYQLFNRTTTAIGQQKLADYLNEIVDKDTILQRQTAISELKDQLDWRQQLRATGMNTEDDPAYIIALKEWLIQPDLIRGNSYNQMALWLFPILGVIGIIVSIFYLPWQIIILFLLPSILLLKKTFSDVNLIIHQAGNAEKILKYYGKIIELVENGTFTSPILTKLQNQLLNNHKKASKEINTLSFQLHQLNVRNNIFAFPINLFGLWDLQWINKLEKWKGTNQSNLPKWFDALAEFETLCGFATVYYNNPDWIFAKITEKPLINALEIGHPLIPNNQRITNSIEIPTQGHIKLLTGSNMAGKSTFLRTIGLNLILSGIGAPICAKSFETPLQKVYTSMRTQDALYENTSSFYAELKRLKFILEAVDMGDNIFFLLDEILKGTNSNDRHNGSKALIKQLIENKGSGIIATHDLELGILEAQYNGAIENLCMEVRVNKDELIFDYKLEKGVSKSFNATLLMKNMGIKINE